MLQKRNEIVNSLFATTLLRFCCAYDIMPCGVSYLQQEGVKKIARLAEVRRGKGWTQEQLAGESGVNRVTIARYETGKTVPKIDTLQRLAVALGVQIDEIVDKKAG
jgi:DNA-binding XRE family transcriptional regulator